MRWVPLLIALGGCDDAFDLVHVELHDAAIDAAIDAPEVPDYDGDGVFAGDNCPAMPNPDQGDDDHDGVGNVCDPHPGQLDVVVDQELFRGKTSMWVPTGAWTIAEGAWQSPPAVDGGALSFPSRTLYRPALQVGFTIDAYDPQLMLRQLELHFDAPTGADCCVRHDPTTGTASQLVLHVEGTTYVSKGISPNYQLGSHYVATYARALTSSCTILAQTVTRSDIAELVTTSPTLILTRMQVTIDHVTLYQVMQ